MAFESLTEKLQNAFRKLRGKGRLTEKDIKEALREVRLALLEADVNFKVVKDFCAKVSERAIGANVFESLSPAQTIIKIVHEELTELMGAAAKPIKPGNRPPTVIMVCGLQGAGKTTHISNLGGLLLKQGHRPLLAACDVYRPAAIDQLKVTAGRHGLPVYQEGQGAPVKIAANALTHAKHRHGGASAHRRDHDGRNQEHRRSRQTI
jgi:signal recognition particle subunit SRP54